MSTEDRTMERVPRLDKDTKREYIDVVKRSLDYQPMDSRQVSMLFYWTRHSDDPEFAFIKAELNLDDSLGVKPKKKKKRFFWRASKSCKQAGSEK